MADDRFVLALDQGTTSSRAIAFDRGGVPVAVAQREFPQGFGSSRTFPRQQPKRTLITKC